LIQTGRVKNMTILAARLLGMTKRKKQVSKK